MTEFMKPSAYNVCYESGAAGEWRARAWRRRVKQVEVEPRGTVHRRYYCFVYEVFAPCTRVTTIRYQAPHSSVSTREVRKCLSSRSLPRISASFPPYSLPCFRYFRVSRHILIKSTYFHGCAFFASFRALHGSKGFSQSPRCILELVILCV